MNVKGLYRVIIFEGTSRLLEGVLGFADKEIPRSE